MPIPRRKSCGHCRTAKSRCSLTIPCERCADRNLNCDYGTAGLRYQPYRVPPIIPLESSHGQTDLSPDGHESSRLAEAFDSQEYTGGTPFAAHRTTSSLGLSESLLERDTDSELLSVFTNAQFQASNSSIFGTGCGTDADNLFMPNIDLSLSTRLGSITESRLLSQRKTTTAETFFTAKVLLGQIRQYPRMMIEGKRLPPFIHPKCASGNWSAYSCASEEKHVCLPEVLAVCANLVHMFYGRTPASSRFVWETIYKHQKKLHNEHLLYRSADLLDALQATVIYLLLQAEDPESVEVNDTLSLIDTISDVAKRYRMLSDYQSEFSNPYTVDRKTWIETESVRRTVNLLWIIELDLNVIIGPPRKIERCGGYSSVPLPCDKWLWDPTVSDAEWTKRYRQSLGKQKPMLCIGDLRFSRQSAAGDGGEVKEGLTEWCEGLEEFGALIWMAGMLERSNS